MAGRVWSVAAADVLPLVGVSIEQLIPKES